MANCTPLVSIGMVAYNGDEFIRQTLDSLLAQTYENFELIISDDMSTDKTQDICLEYLARDERIKYKRNDVNIKEVRNTNQVFNMSTGDYFMWVADHDLYDKKFISRCVEILDNDPSVVLCYPNTIFIDSKGNDLGIIPDHLDTRSISDASQRFRATIPNLHRCNFINGLMRSNALRKTGLYMPVIGPDNLLLAELSLLGSFAEIPQTLFFMSQNRPDEDEIQALQRRLKNLSPNLNTTIPFTLLTLHHLIAVKNASLNLQVKLKLMAFALRFCNRRFGVLEELLSVANLLDVFQNARNGWRRLLSLLGLRRIKDNYIR